MWFFSNFSFLKNSLVQIKSKLNSKSSDYLYKQYNLHFKAVAFDLIRNSSVAKSGIQG